MLRAERSQARQRLTLRSRLRQLARGVGRQLRDEARRRLLQLQTATTAAAQTRCAAMRSSSGETRATEAREGQLDPNRKSTT